MCIECVNFIEQAKDPEKAFSLSIAHDLASREIMESIYEMIPNEITPFQISQYALRIGYLIGQYEASKAQETIQESISPD